MRRAAAPTATICSAAAGSGRTASKAASASSASIASCTPGSAPECTAGVATTSTPTAASIVSTVTADSVHGGDERGAPARRREGAVGGIDALGRRGGGAVGDELRARRRARRAARP